MTGEGAEKIGAPDAIGPWAARAAAEIVAPLAQVAGPECDAFIAAIDGARRIALHGVGREGLMMRALAMRLFHLGLDAHVVGDMTTPPLAAGDLLIASAGPGHLATVGGYMQVARRAGARVALLTAQADAALRPAADLVLVIPARTMAQHEAASAVLPMGSAFEAAQFLLAEYVVAALRHRRGIAEDAMRARHTNLE
ncbi:MAG: 6-phospho-3-hexuloisomerase [Rhodospirillales bacterium]|nr:6-phospho-3-hexuloisomerase [Rhodospirillales bacterium]